MTNFAQTWLNIQCRLIQGVARAVFLLADADQRKLKVAAQWPPNDSEASELLAIARLSAKKHQHKTPTASLTTTKNYDYFAWPLTLNGRLLGIVAVKTSHQAKTTQKNILQALRVGSQWLALPEPTQREKDQTFEKITEFAIAISAQPDLKSTIATIVNTLTADLECERVSYGEQQGDHLQVKAISNTALLTNSSDILNVIGATMNEAADQDTIVNYPATQSKMLITHAHRELTRRYGSGCILTIPLINDGILFAAITLERRESKPFTQREIDICQQALNLSAPLIQLRMDAERPLHERLAKDTKEGAAALLGLKHLRAKAVVLVMIAVLTTMAFWQSPFKITSDAALEGVIQRSIAAPVEGFIKTAVARAGDTIREGDIIATMDDSELQLEQTRLTSEQQQLNREYREALANRDLVEVRVLNAKLSQTDAQRKLVSEQLERTQIRAPFDAIVIDGDLSQSLGAPVTRGENLFTVAPLDGYRVILKVRENDIAYIEKSQSGNLLLSSLPDQTLQFTVRNITQIATSEAGDNLFRVEAELLNPPANLRPGMAGIAKVEITEKSLLWIWSRDLREWLHLQWWRLLP